MKKTFTLLSAILISSLAAIAAPMTGAYTIGGTSPNFITIQEACDSLQSRGVSGAVVFNIRDGVYTEAVLLDSVNGVSASNTITFQSQSLNNTLVTITSAAITFDIVGVSYVRFNHVTLSSTALEALYFRNATSFQASNCIFNGASSYWAVQASNYLSGNGTSVTDNSSFTNCTVTGDYGIYFNAENIYNFSLSNTTINTNYTSFYLYADRVLKNTTINSSTITSANNSAVELYGYYSNINKVNIHNSTLRGLNDVVYMYSDFTTKNITVNNSTLRAYSPASGSSWGLNIEGYYNMVDSVSINKVATDSIYNGLRFYSNNGTSKNIWIDSSSIIATDRGIYEYGDNISETHISKSVIKSKNSRAVDLYADYNLDNVSFSMDSVISSSNYGIYLYSSNTSINNVMIDNAYVRGDSSSYDAAYIYSSSSSLKNVTIKNSNFRAQRGIYFYGEQNIENVMIDNVWASGKSGRGLYFYVNYGSGKNIILKNSTFIRETGFGEGTYFYGNDGGYDGITIHNCNFTSQQNGEGIEFSAYSGLHNLMIKNSTFNSNNDDAAQIYNDYGGLTNVTIDSCVFNANNNQEALQIEGYYNPGMSNVTITNSDFNVMGSNGEGIYSYSDSKIENVTIKNNNFNIKTSGWGYGIDIEGYGGTSNVLVEGNDFKIGGSGGSGTAIYLEYLDSNNVVRNNTIDTTLNNSSMSTGMYLDAEYQGSPSGLIVENNDIHNAYYGLDLEYGLNNVTVRNNNIHNDASSNGYGIYMYDIGNFNISHNQFLNTQEYYGIYFDDVRPAASTKGWVTNNFFSNYEQGAYFENSSENIVIANNSYTTKENSDFFYLDNGVNHIDFYNNIIKVDSVNYTSDLFYFDDASLVGNMNNNICNIDTTTANYVRDNFYGNNYSSIHEWNTYSGKDGNSFYKTVMFINDTTDLHVMCSDNALKAGMPLAAVKTDIDGNLRAAVPTIGADEILASIGLLGNDTAWICNNTIMLDAGSSQGASYLWSTGATTQTIWVSAVGVYSATLTDACGSHTGTKVVDYQNRTVANFTGNISFLTGTFTNTSTKASSYSWNFGDGGTSTAVNPFHIYSTPGTYTVTLIAWGTCNSDTTAMVVSPNTVGMNENANDAGMSVYPNPSNGQMNVVVANKQGEEAVIQVVNLTGQIIYSERIANGLTSFQHAVDISAYPVGMYFVNVIMEGSTNTVRVVKQ